MPNLPTLQIPNIDSDQNDYFNKTRLITCVHDLAETLNDGEQIGTILLDFSKSFDKVSHGKLCLTLQDYGIRGNSLKWVENFLNNRPPKVVVSGERSPSVSVTSGVPHGTALGPLLFLFNISDLPNSVSLSISLFTDDSYVYRRIRNRLYCKQLHNDFDNLVKWEKEWSMEFNPSKCKLLIVTNRVKPVQHCYKMHAIYLENIVQEKYLGVILHRKLSWKPHVSNIRDAALIFYVVRRTT